MFLAARDRLSKKQYISKATLSDQRKRIHCKTKRCGHSIGSKRRALPKFILCGNVAKNKGKDSDQRAFQPVYIRGGSEAFINHRVLNTSHFNIKETGRSGCSNNNTLVKHETAGYWRGANASAKRVSSTVIGRGQSSARVPVCFPPRLSRLPCLQALSQDGPLMAQ